MSRPTAAEKAVEYLVDGRIVITRVVAGEVQGFARGDGRLWRFRYQAGAWTCQCAARSDQCSHLRAARRVVAVGDEPNPRRTQ